MGRGGLYFRSTLPSASHQRVPPAFQDSGESGVQFHNIESGATDKMVDSSSASLLEEINAKCRKWRIWPWASGGALLVLLILAICGAPSWSYIVASLFCIPGIVGAVYADRLRKAVVLFYQMEPHIEQAYQKIHDAFVNLSACSRIWHVDARGDVVTTYDWKVNAGADALVRRTAANPRIGAPAYFHCNIAIPTLPAGRKKLFFLPDRVLVWDSAGVGAVGFNEIEIKSSARRFIETETVPRDAQVVDSTWRYANKSGGPDHRFKNNRQIPVVLYEEMFLTSLTGLREMFHCSRTQVASALSAAAAAMSIAMSQRPSDTTPDGFIKCPCNNCDIHIEFPESGVGQTVKCPHCGMDTVLFKPVVT